VCISTYNIYFPPESGQTKLMESDIIKTIGSFLRLPETTTDLQESILDLFAALIENGLIITSPFYFNLRKWKKYEKFETI